MISRDIQCLSDIARLTPHLLRDVPALQETETEAPVCKVVGQQSCSCSDTPPLCSMLRLAPDNEPSSNAAQKGRASADHDTPLTMFNDGSNLSQFDAITMPTHHSVSSNLPFPVIGPCRAECALLVRAALFFQHFIPDSAQLNVVSRGSFCNRLLSLKVPARILRIAASSLAASSIASLALLSRLSRCGSSGQSA